MSDDASQLGRMLAARRRQITTTCVACGKPIVGTVRRRYCNTTCKVNAFRARQRGQDVMPRDETGERRA